MNAYTLFALLLCAIVAMVSGVPVEDAPAMDAGYFDLEGAETRGGHDHHDHHDHHHGGGSDYHHGGGGGYHQDHHGHGHGH